MIPNNSESQSQESGQLPYATFAFGFSTQWDSGSNSLAEITRKLEMLASSALALSRRPGLTSLVGGSDALPGCTQWGHRVTWSAALNGTPGHRRTVPSQLEVGTTVRVKVTGTISTKQMTCLY